MERASRLLGKVKLSPDVAAAETRARKAWEKAAGAKAARHTRATALVRGTLIVEVEDIVWQKNLNLLRHFLLSNLARELGELVVTGLDFRPMTPRRGPQRAEAARPALPITPQRDDAERIADPVMRMLYLQSRKKESA